MHFQHDEELAIKAKERDERKKKEAAEKQKRIDRGLETESDAGDGKEVIIQYILLNYYEMFEIVCKRILRYH